MFERCTGEMRGRDARARCARVDGCACHVPSEGNVRKRRLRGQNPEQFLGTAGGGIKSAAPAGSRCHAARQKLQAALQKGNQNRELSCLERL